MSSPTRAPKLLAPPVLLRLMILAVASAAGAVIAIVLLASAAAAAPPDCPSDLHVISSPATNGRGVRVFNPGMFVSDTNPPCARASSSSVGTTRLWMQPVRA